MENNSRNDYDIALQNRKTRCLHKISELCKRLTEQEAQYPQACEKYLQILDGLKRLVSKPRSLKHVIDRCEDELNRYWNIISSSFSLPRERETSLYSRSPDSTATNDNAVNVISESGSRSKESHDADSEVSSSSSKISSMHVPDNTFPSLYSRRRDTSIESERSGSEIDDPVQLIMNTVKNRLGRDMLNQSSHSNYGMSSSEEIERYEGTLKSQFFENEPPKKVPARETHDENKLSSMLEKMMVRRESSSALEIPSTSTSEKPSTSNVNAESSIPDLNNLNLSPDNKNTDTEEKKDKPISLRAKMAQDIGTLHKAGESNKIRPSLKQLKSDNRRSRSPPAVKLDLPSTRPDDKNSTSSSKDKDDYRSIKSSDFRRHNDRYPHSPRSPMSHSSRSSPHGYRSPRDSQDDYHRSDRRRRSRSRSHSRHRDQYSESSSSNITSPRNFTKDSSQPKSLESFVNSIGHGRCPPNQRKDDENQKKDDRSKSDADDSRPNFKVKKKNFMKFKLDTNLTASNIEQNVENDADDSKPNFKVNKKNFIKFKVDTNLTTSNIEQNVENDASSAEPTPTTNHSDIPPISPVYSASPRYNSSPACSESSSASSRVTPTVDPRFSKVNNYNDRRERFTNVNKADPRLKQTFPKTIDPRLERQSFQKPNFLKDPRAPPPLMSTLTKNNDRFRSRGGVQPPEAGFSNIPRTSDAGFPKDPRVPASPLSDPRVPTSPFPGTSRETNDVFRPRAEMPPPESNFPKDPRPIPSIVSGITKETNANYSSFSQNKSKPSTLPPPSSTFVPPPATKENKANHSSFSQAKPTQPKRNNWTKNNKYVINNTKPFSPDHKKNFKGNVLFEPKNNLPKPRSSNDIKEQVKNSNEFLSPLQDIFQTSEVAKTGRGYGAQRLKKNAPGPTLKKFTIPKLRKPSAETEKFTGNSASSVQEKRTSFSNDDEDWNVSLNDATPEKPVGNSTSFAKGNKKKIFHDDDDWDAAISSNDDVGSVTTTQSDSSLTSDNTYSIANDNRSNSNVDENRRNSTVSENRPSSTVTENRPNSTTNENRRNSTDTAAIDITANIDEEECWDPVDSPVENTAETNASEDVIEIPPKETVTIEIEDDDAHGHDDVEDLTEEKSGDEVIEIDDNDDVEKTTSRRVRSVEKESTIDLVRPTSSSAPTEVYSLETDDSDEPVPRRNRSKVGEKQQSVEVNDSREVQKRLSVEVDSNSATTYNLPTRKNSAVQEKECSVVETRRSSDNNVQQDTPPSEADKNKKQREEILKTKLLNYLNSLSNPPEITEKEKQLSPAEFVIKLFTKIDLKTFTELQAILTRHQDSDEDEPEEIPEPEKIPEPEVIPQVEESPEVPQLPIDDEKKPPVKGTRGRKKSKKNIAKASTNLKAPVELKAPAEPKPSTSTTSNPPRRRARGNTELNSLLADIDKMKHTKNNILNIGETRSCRLQTANYSEKKTYRRSNEDWMSSESEFDGTTRSGIRRTRSKPDLISDSDSISSNKKFKSKPIISSDSDSDSDDDSFLNGRRILKESMTDTYDTIRKYKACPRRKKVERFGSVKYQQFEESENRKDLSYMLKKHCPKYPIPVLPLYPDTCDNLDSCICHSKEPSNHVKPEPNEDKLKVIVNSFFSKQNEKPVTTHLKNDAKSPRKRKLKPGKTSKLRMKMSKSGHYPSWQVVNQVKNQKSVGKKDQMPDDDASTSDIIAQPSPIIPASDSQFRPAFAPGSSTVSQGKQSSENIVTDDDANDELKDLPSYNAFKNSEITSIKIATIGVRVCDSALVYICKTSSCVYESVDIAMFALHITFLHKDWKIDTGCETCGDARRYLNLKTAFRHLLDEHLIIIPGTNLTPIPSTVRIKEEPIDELPTNDVVMNEENTPDTHDLTENGVSNSTPVLAAEVPWIIEPALPTPPPRIPSPEKVPVSPKTSSILRNAPKIRVRRFSGDKLSGPDTSSDSQRSTPEIRNFTEHYASSPSETGSNVGDNISNVVFVNADRNATTLTSNVGSSRLNNQLTSGNICVNRNTNNPLSNAVPELDISSYNFTEVELNLMQFYKCSEETCGFSTNHKKEFLNHLHYVHKGVKRNRKFDPACLICKFCQKKFDTPEMLVIHMEKYENCKFQCAYCEFRASRPVFIIWHLNASHVGRAVKILVSSLNDNKDSLSDCKDQEKDPREVVAALNCVHCNNFQTISLEEYKDHWKRNHSQTDSLECYICKTPYLSVDRFLKCLKFHGYAEFQCIYCIQGASTEDEIKSHLLREHYTLYPKAVKRITPKDPETANKFDDYIEILDLDEPFDNLKQHFRVIDQNKATAVTLHADTPDGTVSATVNVGNEPSDKAGDSNSDDVIAVCSSDDDTSDRLVINEDAPAALTKTTAKPAYSNGLSGTDLYKCGFEGCTAAFETYIPFKDHLSICDNARNRTSPKCPHCNRTFQKNAAFLTHVGLHGVPRYICSLCDNRFTTPKKAEDHVKQNHKVNLFKVIPANPLKNNSHEDLYIVLPNSKMEAYSGDKNEIIPAFVPKTLRYSCGAPDCVYRSTDANRLKSHWETLHSELNFNCPHCGVVIPVEKIHTHLRYHDGRLYKCYYCTKLHYQRQGIENHQLESHPDSPSQVQIIRELTADEIEELCREARYQSDGSYNRNIVTYSRTSLWKCNLCKSYPMMSEELIKSHCLSFHRVGQQFKCCLCTFADDDVNQVNKHMNEKHESISQVIVTVYKELTENDENSQSSSNTSSPCRMRKTSQNSFDGQQQNVAGTLNRNVADKCKTNHSSRNEIDDSQLAEMNDLLILPLPNNRYRCPFCDGYNTTDRKSMREHLYQEKKYERYVCYDCGTHSVTEDEIRKHAENAHGENINVGKFSEDEVIEKQVEQILDYQQNKFSQVNGEASIEISSEDEDAENNSKNSVRSTGSYGDRPPMEFRCPHCPKVCSNSAGLKNHISYVHIKKSKKGKAHPQTPVPVVPKPTAKISPVSGTIVPNVGGVYPCSYCHKEFTSAATIAKHLCVCPKYTHPNDNSPTKLSEVKVLASDRVLACSYCGKRCDSLDIDDHIAMCKIEQMNRFQQIIRCETCGLEMDQSLMEMHRKCKHIPMECLNCDKILIGSDQLDNHVHESLINISGLNHGCIAQEKEVVIMCPYCPTGLIGQSYDKYTYISDHIAKKHNPIENPPKNIRVKIRSIVRELMESEITLMQSKYNQEQAMNSLPLPPDKKKKKRNVAVKSTTRTSASSISNICDGRTASVPKIQRIGVDSAATNDTPKIFYPVPKINIIPRNANR